MNDPGLRCSIQYRAADPIGTAGDYEAYLLVEVPLPWGKDVEAHPRLVDVVAGARATGVRTRVLGVVPERDDHEGVRVIAYTRPPGPFRAFERRERETTEAELVATCNELLTSDAELTADAVPGDAHTSTVRTDVLLCTHGSRDRCCGSFGMNLYTAIGVRYTSEGIRTWRVSHTGGHRFAPTAILLPEGTMWAWLDTDLVDGILHRSIEPALVAPHYRGSSAVGDPAVQVAEREAFVREGWGWLDSHRQATVVEQDDERFRIRLDATRPDGTATAYEAVVMKTGIVAQPVCGEPISAAKKADAVWSLRTFAAVEDQPVG